MPLLRAALPGHARVLLDCLRDATSGHLLDDRGWEVLIRSARTARLLGVIAAKAERAGLSDQLPDSIRRHLIAAGLEARFRRQKVLFMIDTVARLLLPLNAPLVLLKGAAYIAQSLPMADGRMPADVDLMIPRRLLDDAESRLTAAGWEFEMTDPYDQHYYRAWSHELPPLRCAGQALELDLHHTILPPTGRVQPDIDAILGCSVGVNGGVFRVLSPVDQVLHAAAHLFQDSDCVGRLRDLVDIDALAREFSVGKPGFWDALQIRARLHRMGRPLWYALTLAHAWLDTPIPAAGRKLLREFEPPWLARRLVLGLAARVLPPVDPDSEPTAGYRISSALLKLRAVWLRMPLWLLAYHATRKAVRGISVWRRQRSASSARP